MILDRPLPFQEAIDFLMGKQLLPTTLSAEQMAALSEHVRATSFWSAKVSDGELLRRALDLVGLVVDPTRDGAAPGSGVDKSRFRELIRGYLSEIGYSPDPGVQGTIQDLTTDARLNLIIETNTQMIQGYGQAVQRNAPAARDAFPCDELVRIANFSAVSRGTARPWPRTWSDAGGRFYGGGRMIARRDSEVWRKISHFGNPYPPFNYKSGMWTRPVARKEAEDLGVIARGEKAEAMTLGNFTAGLQMSVKDFPAALQEALQAAIPGAGIRDGVLMMEGG